MRRVARETSQAARPSALRRQVVLAALGLLAVAPRASAEEWHEAYRAGLAALQRGAPAAAVERFQRAIALQPEPGRNVVTYGTNVEPRYYPYLRLAEAYLALGRLDETRQALDASAARGKEPAAEREALASRLEAARTARTATTAPPTTTTVPAAAPTTTPPSSGSDVAAATPTSATAAPAPAATPPLSSTGPPPTPSNEAPTKPPVEPKVGSRVLPPPVSRPTPGAALPQPSPVGSLEIVSQPPRAAVYVDDEPIGSTDPETGRILRRGIAAGSHRVRVTLSGHEDATRTIEVPQGGNASFHAALKPLAPETRAPEGIGWLAFAAVVLALVASIAWVALRPSRPETPSVWSRTPASAGAARRGSALATPNLVNPGAVHDASGQEWFGDFRLLELLGRGGMASVYKAERGGDLCALKRPLANYLDDDEFLRRFSREAEISRTLNHPNIVRVLQRGEVGQVPYFTMELVEGETLQAFIRRQEALAPRHAALIVAQVAEALDFAHSKGVVHRDLKPSNVMLLADGTVKVMDFGIARARRFEGLTTTGVVLGTPEYLAPETIEGHVTEPRSDLYALGVVFYELLTGQRPFAGETPFVVLRKHCSDEPLPPSQIVASVPPPLEALVLRLLRKTPAARPESAEEVVVALRDWLNRGA